MELLKPLGIETTSKRIHFYVSQEDDTWARHFIKTNLPLNKKIIGIIPSGGWASKRCDASKWVKIRNAIKLKFDVIFLILWGPGDESDANFIKSNLKVNAVLIPEVKIGKLSSLIRNCHLVIANDSDRCTLLHVSEFQHLEFLDQQTPKLTGPYSPNSDYVIKEDLDCIICNKLECPYHHECMKELSVEEVVSKCKS